MEVYSVIILFFLIAAIAAIIMKDIYDSTNHSSCDDISLLREGAKPQDVQRKIVGTKGHRRVRTTVLFDDGFRYISHKTDVENHLFYYSVSTPTPVLNEILVDAIIAHDKMLKRKKGRE